MRKVKNLKENIISYLAIILEVVGFVIIIYLITMPFYPALKYKFSNQDESLITNVKEISTSSDIALIKEQAKEIYNSFPQSEYSVSKNRLIISKIGVNAPIVESDNEAYGLSKGAWRLPDSSTPDKGGNTVITGHRFRYLPPNNMTFYLFHKLEIGDIVTIIWNDEEIVYKISETKIVPDTEVSVLNQSKDPIITMFTCDPIYSTKNRLVVIAEPIK